MAQTRKRLTNQRIAEMNGQAGDFYEKRTYEPARDTSYGSDGAWLKYEEVKPTEKLGPDEPRDELGFGEFKDTTFKDNYKVGKANKEAEAKADKCIKIAEVLLPNLKTSEIEDAAALLFELPKAWVDTAHDTVNTLSTGVAAAVETKKATEEKKASPAPAPAAAKKAESEKEEEKKEEEEEEKEASVATAATEKIVFAEELPEEGVALNTEDQLLADIFSSGTDLNPVEAKTASKKGISKLGGSIAPGGSVDVKLMEKMWHFGKV